MTVRAQTLLQSAAYLKVCAQLLRSGHPIRIQSKLAMTERTCSNRACLCAVSVRVFFSSNTLVVDVLLFVGLLDEAVPDGAALTEVWATHVFCRLRSTCFFMVS